MRKLQILGLLRRYLRGERFEALFLQRVGDLLGVALASGQGDAASAATATGDFGAEGSGFHRDFDYPVVQFIGTPQLGKQALVGVHQGADLVYLPFFYRFPRLNVDRHELLGYLPEFLLVLALELPHTLHHLWCGAVLAAEGDHEIQGLLDLYELELALGHALAPTELDDPSVRCHCVVDAARVAMECHLARISVVVDLLVCHVRAQLVAERADQADAEGRRGAQAAVSGKVPVQTDLIFVFYAHAFEHGLDTCKAQLLHHCLLCDYPFLLGFLDRDIGRIGYPACYCRRSVYHEMLSEEYYLALTHSLSHFFPPLGFLPFTLGGLMSG